MYCTECGKSLKENDKFCSSCGKNVEINTEVINNEITEEESSSNEHQDITTKPKESSKLKKEYFKWLIIITLIFGLLEVALVFFLPFGEIHLKVLSTIGLIVVFGIFGLLLINLYEASDQNQYPFIGIGTNVATFVLSSLLTWEILTHEFFFECLYTFFLLLFSLTIISSLYTVFSDNKYYLSSRKITSNIILCSFIIYTLGIFYQDLYEKDLYIRSMWAISILIFLGLFITLLLSKINNNIKRSKKKGH